jgi:uncharacterized protein (DUF736 family)
MPEYDDEMSGVLFPAREKKSDRSPDFTGKCTINGNDFRIAAWTRVPRSGGNKFLSLAFTKVEDLSEGVDAEGALEL